MPRAQIVRACETLHDFVARRRSLRRWRRAGTGLFLAVVGTGIAADAALPGGGWIPLAAVLVGALASTAVGQVGIRRAGLVCPHCGTLLVGPHDEARLAGRACGTCGGAVVRRPAAFAAVLTAATYAIAREAYRAAMTRAYVAFLAWCVVSFVIGMLLRPFAGAIADSALPLAVIAGVVAGLGLLVRHHKRTLRRLSLTCPVCRAGLAGVDPRGRGEREAAIGAGQCWYCSAPVLGPG